MIRVAAGILFQEGRILACQRRGPGPFALKWEFPGGKIRPGETPRAALVRELEEELGIQVEAEELIPEETVTHRYPQGREVELHFFRVERFAGRIENREFADLAWVAPGDLPALDFLEADRPLVARLAGAG